MLATILIGYPFARLLVDAFSVGGTVWRAVLLSATTQLALKDTAVASATAALVAIVLGGVAALATERGALPGRTLLRGALLLPALIPPFISAFAWAQAYGPAGWLDRSIGLQLPGLFGGVGVTLLLAVHGMPFVYLTVAAALRSRGAGDLERAARASGASAWVAVRTITLPLLRPALIAGGGLAFLSAASDFGIPAFVGVPGRFPTLTTEIYRRLVLSSSAGSFEAATALATLLAVTALAILAGIGRAGGGIAVETGRGGTNMQRQSGLGDRAAALALWCLILAVSGLPFFALVLIGLTKSYGLPQTPANWTLAHFATLFRTPRLAQSLVHSVLLAAGAATIALALGALVATVAGGRRRGRWLAVVVALPYAVPGSTVAVATILAFSRWFYGSFAILILAYLARFWALAERPVAGALAQVGRDGVRAARASGAGAVRAAWDVVVPVIRPALFVAWALVFLAAFHELTITSLLYGPRTQTISVIVLDTQQAGQTPVTAAIAVVLTLVVLAGTLPLIASRRLARLAGFA